MSPKENLSNLQITLEVGDQSSSCDSLMSAATIETGRDDEGFLRELSVEEDSGTSQSLKFYWSKTRGFFFAITSGLLLTVYSFLFKKTNAGVVMPTVLLIRGMVECCTLTTVAVLKHQSPFPSTDNGGNGNGKVGLLMLVVATMGGFRALFIFLGLQLLDMSSVHVIINAAPVVVTLMSVCCLGERLTWSSVSSCLLLLVGIGCIFGPSIVQNGFGGQENGSGSSELLGLGFSIVALIFNSSVSVFGKKVNLYFTQHWITAFNGASIIATSLVMYTIDDSLQSLIRGFTAQGNVTVGEAHNIETPTTWPQDMSMWLLVLGTAVSGMLQQFTFFCALHYESAARTSMIRSIQMVFSWLVEIGEGHEVKLLTIFGIFIILLAIFVITIERDRTSLRCFAMTKTEENTEEKGATLQNALAKEPEIS